MFSKISIKVRIAIFLAACAIGIFILINEGIQNRNNHASNRIEKPNAVIISSDDVKKNNEALRKAEEDKLKEEQAKALEDKYNEGYKAFFDHKYTEAVTIEDQVLDKDSSFYKAYNLKGIALCFNGNYEEGMKNIDKALELKPDFGYAVFNKALAYELYGHYDEAIEWYNKDLKLESYVWSYYGIASIYGRRGNVKNAIEYLKQAAVIDNGVKSLAKDEKDFDPIKNTEEFKNFINN
jgi:tetratricopeptide (TPR) repeat protein